MTTPPPPPQPAAPGPDRRNVVAWVILAGLGLAVVGSVLVSMVNDPVGDLADDTCRRLEDAIVLQVGGIVNRATSEAESMGSSGPELGEAMRERCPGMIAAMQGIADEQEADNQLPSQVEVLGVSCGADQVNGEIRNNSDRTVTVFLDVRFYDSGETVLLDSSTASVSGLDPGQTGRYESYVPVGSYERCRVVVSSVFGD